MKVLTVDDDQTVRIRLRRYLQEWGHEAVEANSGEKAWELFKQGRYPMAIVDWMMPGVDGVELIKRIRAETGQGYVYLIMLTMRSEMKDLVEGMDAGADDFITKPFDKDELYARFRSGERILGLENRLEANINELRRSNEDLQQFVYAASHDLKEPLRSISGFAQILSDKFRQNLGKEAIECIDFINSGAFRMGAVIDDLLKYSRVSAAQQEVAHAESQACLDNALKNLAAAIKANGATVTHPTLPSISIDETHLTQLFQNLIGNSIKYRSDEPPEIHISAELDSGEMIRFNVRDNGIGIPEQFQKDVFQIFRRLHTQEEYEGTGIGLSICKKIVELYGGQIWVESQSGKGCNFLFTLPA